MNVQDITVIAATVTTLGVMLGLHWKLVKQSREAVEDKLHSYDLRLKEAASALKEIQQREADIAISIVTPTGFWPEEPVRQRGESYTVGEITGTARGPFGAAYVATRKASGHPLLAAELAIRDGFWKAEVKLLSWQESEKHEIFAFAVPERAEFPVWQQFELPDNAVVSKSIEVKASFVPKDGEERKNSG